MYQSLTFNPVEHQIGDNYIRQRNAFCGEVFSTHGDLLARKNVHDKRRLIHIFKRDLDKLTQALLTVKHQSAGELLQAFFREQPAILQQVLSCLQRDRLYHLGFEIQEPLDIALFGIHHWIAEVEQTLGATLRISKLLRFPASLALQQRVNAYTEIMRLWLVVDGQELMLELFDLYRPVDALLAQSRTSLMHRNFHALHKQEQGVAPSWQQLTHLFAGDTIWHYALYIETATQVAQLHQAFASLVQQSEFYQLAYPQPIHNQHDGSLHTKLINRVQGIEIEFVTQVS